jgi:hypothetical protein
MCNVHPNYFVKAAVTSIIVSAAANKDFSSWTTKERYVSAVITCRYCIVRYLRATFPAISPGFAGLSAKNIVFTEDWTRDDWKQRCVECHTTDIYALT